MTSGEEAREHKQPEPLVVSSGALGRVNVCGERHGDGRGLSDRSSLLALGLVHHAGSADGVA